MNAPSILFLAMLMAMLLAGVIGALRNPRGAWPIITVMILFAGLAVQTNLDGSPRNQTWLQGVQLLRSPLYLISGSALFLATLVHMGKVRLHDVPFQGFVIFAIQLLCAILRFDHEGFAGGAQSVVFTVVTMIPVLLLLPHAFKEWDDWTVFIRAIGIAATIWALANFVQVVLDPNQLILGWHRRFSGLLGNPQGTGLYMAPMTICLLWLLMNETKRLLWWIWGGAFCLIVVYSLWTGSRTCILVTGVGTMFVLYSRLGRFILVLPIIGLAFFGVFQLAVSLGLSIDAVERLTSTENTREASWEVLMEDMFNNPFLGYGFKESRANENSYLLALGAYGIFTGALVIFFPIYSFFYMLKFWRYRKLVPAGQRQLVDLILAFNAAYFAGSCFEWHIIARLEVNLLLIMLFAVMSKRLMQKVDAELTTQDLYADEYAHYGPSHTSAELHPDNPNSGHARPGQHAAPA